LRQRGEAVRYPELPDPFDPFPEAWLDALHPELDALDGERIVLCHSLACLLWLNHARAGASEAAERVLLVAPPCTDDVEPVVRFRPHGVTAEDVRRAANETLMICSDSDPYCPDGAVAKFADPLGIEFMVIPGGGHLNTDAGYGPWGAVEEWALAH
jgi:predicted alpha/beta hydrolase family esterase